MLTESLMRWPGSKRHCAARIAPMIERHLEVTGGRLVSLFYGSARIETQVGNYNTTQLVAEAVPDLRALYRVLGAVGGSKLLLDACNMVVAARADAIRGAVGSHKLRGSESTEHEANIIIRDVVLAFYGYVRDQLSFAVDGTRAADALIGARFLFLVGTCFNGLWRVNASGRMNTPPDPERVITWRVPSDVMLQAAAINARRLTMFADWRELAAIVQPGDLILSDPPYVAGFDDYTAGGFPEREHVDLARGLTAISSTCGVIAFNSPEGRRFYDSSVFTIEEIKRSGRINSKVTDRGAVAELLITAGLQGQEAQP